MIHDPRQLAEKIRQACLQAAAEACEQADISGLCAEGRREVALDAIRQLDIAKLIESAQDCRK